MTSKVTYLGSLRTLSIHQRSGSEIISDAPVDNNGNGAAFSPSDIVANALASCMMTIMGIKAEDMEINMEGSTAEVTKTMKTDPRMISKIEVVFHMNVKPEAKKKLILERAANTCPVFLSLHPDIEKKIIFNWG